MKSRGYAKKWWELWDESSSHRESKARTKEVFEVIVPETNKARKAQEVPRHGRTSGIVCTSVK